LKYYPVGLNIRDKDVLVVGAGRVAERKVRQLRSFGAKVSVVAPQVSRYITRLSKDGAIKLFKRIYRPSDIFGARLVIAATSDAKTNEKISADAHKRNIFVNVVDCSSQSDFISSAVIRRKGLVISVSTDAKYPVLSKRFKDFLKGKIDEFDAGRDQL
jgi:precorrin-2 dehydrogenase/sirohydrochlorin ferrochelatase